MYREYTIPSGTTFIDEFSIEDRGVWEKIIIPNTVTTIETKAFSGCKSLKSINIPKSVVKIGSDAFKGCSSLERISIPSSLYYIGHHCFQDCTSLSKITLPKALKSIEWGLFSGCLSLEEIVIYGNVKIIEDSAFSGCINLHRLFIHSNEPDKILIDDDSFDLTSISNIEVYIPEDVIRSGIDRNKWARFYDVYGFNPNPIKTTQKFSSKKITIEYEDIVNRSFLKKIVIPEGVTRIGKNAFEGCAELHDVVLPESLKSIGDFAFSGCVSLKKILLPQQLEEILPFAFSGCINLNSITIPENVTVLGTNTFEGCYNLRSVDFRSTTNYISTSMFKNCINLQKVNFPKTLKRIYPYSFYGCLRLKNVFFEDGLMYIDEHSFENCKTIESLILPNGFINIGEKAFLGCSHLGYIELPSSVRKMSDYCFSECNNITKVVIKTENETTFNVRSFSYSNKQKCKLYFESSKIDTNIINKNWRLKYFSEIYLDGKKIYEKNNGQKYISYSQQSELKLEHSLDKKQTKEFVPLGLNHKWKYVNPSVPLNIVHPKEPRMYCVYYPPFVGGYKKYKDFLDEPELDSYYLVREQFISGIYRELDYDKAWVARLLLYDFIGGEEIDYERIDIKKLDNEIYVLTECCPQLKEIVNQFVKTPQYYKELIKAIYNKVTD